MPKARKATARKIASIDLAVIPAAGLGTRLLPATRSQPKEMLPVGRKPSIQYVVEELALAGIKEVLLVSGRGKRAIEDHLDRDITSGEEKHQPWMDLDIFHVRQSLPKGLADAINLSRPFAANRPFVVALGDSIILSSAKEPLLKHMMDLHLQHRPAATIAVETVPHSAVNRYGIVSPRGKPDGTFFIDDIVEKPLPQEAPSNLSAAGRYILEPVVFDAIRRTKPGIGGEIWLTDAFRILLQEGHNILCVRLRKGERRLDIGNFLSYFQAFVELGLNDKELGATFRAWLRKRLKGVGKGN